MKIVQINLTCGSGSTGKICVEVSKLLTSVGIENYILYSVGKSAYPLGIKYTDERYIKTQALRTRVNGLYGFNSKYATKRLLKELDKIKPDVIHLHNLHGHNCNLNLLFSYIKDNGIKVFWTFHDCWAFTAYCPHFDMTDCSKWMNKCERCPQYRRFSWIYDKSEELYFRKKALVEGLNLTIITPSQWLANLVTLSFFRSNDVRIINNGIDLLTFTPRESNFRKKYNIPANKKIILGVAFGWGYRKGLDVFQKLSETVDSEQYQIVLVGTDVETEKALAKNIIAIRRTQNQVELAEIYSSADLLVNPTREDTFPTVNIEALACGTPILTFNTGGSPEILDETCGSVVATDDFDTLKEEIIRICETKPYTKEACLQRAKLFDCNEKYKQYYELYKELL